MSAGFAQPYRNGCTWHAESRAGLVRTNTDLGKHAWQLSSVGMRTEGSSLTHSEHDASEAQEASPALEEERISLANPQQVHEWATKLGVTPEHLRELIAQVGPRPCDVQQRLSQPEAID